jgi:hypothetical protein
MDIGGLWCLPLTSEHQPDKILSALTDSTLTTEE